MTTHPLLLILAAGGLLATAGCVGDSGGGAQLDFDATGNGNESDSAKCDDDATLVGSGQVDDGQVTIRVTDGDGEEQYERVFDGGVNVESERLTGAKGSWTLTATRASDSLLGTEFNGNYSFNLSC